MGFLKDCQQAYSGNKAEAERAYSIYRGYCGGVAPRRVPGMDTVIRLAHRISKGWTVEEAAAKEYVYRWHLAIKAPDQCIGTMQVDPCVSIFGTPHTIGL